MQLHGANLLNFYKLTLNPKEDKSILDLSREVRIPHYQRPFEWPAQKVETLIEDWRKAGATDYFAGLIVSVVSEDKKTNDQEYMHQLVDGQQRFTTIFLANFICFLLSRVLLRESVNTTRVFDLSDTLDSYEKSLRYLFFNIDNNKKISDEFNKTKENIVMFGRHFTADKRSQEIKEKALKELSLSIGLPNSNIFESNGNYIEAHHSALYKFLDPNENHLTLSYDRDSYNKELKDVLSRVCITLNTQDGPKLAFHPTDNENFFKNNYVKAIETIYNTFLEKVPDDSPFEIATTMLHKITSFLEKVEFCVVQTGNVNDAYTLFEVLNDRAHSLDDLALIKNQFYKKFVLSNENTMEANEIDDVIQEIDSQWVDSIFKNEIPSKRELIAYLGISFITGEQTLALRGKAGIPYRTAIESYLASLDCYSEADIRTHFNVFQACKILLDTFEVKFGNQARHAIEQEASLHSSTLLKTIHLLMVLKQDGVLAGLINYVLNYCSFDNKSLEPTKFTTKIESLKGKDCPQRVSEQAYAVWVTSMLSNNADRGREFAKTLIVSNQLGKTLTDKQITANDLSLMKKEFENNLKSWVYNQKSEKIRVLFARLIKLEKKNDVLSLPSGSARTLHSSIELDHMEPQNPIESSKKLYLDSPDREQFISSLGNMMPLTKKENGNKANKPLRDSFVYYDKDGLINHFLLKDAKKLYEEFKNEHGAPLESFFDARRNLLIEDFIKAIEIKPAF